MASIKESIGRLDIIPVREVFNNEAHQFTPWLENHIEILAERLGIELNVIQREKIVGDFNVDLLCEDENEHPVIIENQLEKTDHDHLGKLLTYMVNLEAGTAIWITSEPRPEHQKVISWLNESTPADKSFYLVRIETTRIGDSPFAPLFTILSGPDKQAKEIGEKKKEWAERHYIRVEFWKSLLERSKEKTKLFSNIKPGPSNWISTGSGRSGISYNYVVWMDRGGFELYIDCDHDTGKGNKIIYDELFRQKEQIEREFGDSLEWQRLNDKRASRIRKRFDSGGLSDTNSWPILQDLMINGMISFENTLNPKLSKLK